MLRRRFLAGLASASAALGWRRVGADAPWQPRTPGAAAFLARAIDLARTGSERGDGTPYGAVVVRRGRIVGEGWNRAHAKNDPTAHAEIEAIQDAARRLGRRDLSDCVLYASGGRPCPMCEGGAYFANIGRVVHGHSADAFIDAGPPRLGRC